ncbi:hypothetical protein EYF80_024811 [Liparis tanakae]|uniref:Uncharacterized protein n=1 Tax=Liparis tanakae TaxID=230148 RepID=A0A4Z2HGD7_9TELE|nr:hypothetical protein EYF80_024811 [Liparis tanakae]
MLYWKCCQERNRPNKQTHWGTLEGRSEKHKTTWQRTMKHCSPKLALERLRSEHVMNSASPTHLHLHEEHHQKNSSNQRAARCSPSQRRSAEGNARPNQHNASTN